MINSHVSFPSIGALYNVVASQAERPDLFPETSTYRGKVKLHGTNVGVRITKDGVAAQGRNIDLNDLDHGQGFLEFVKENRDYFYGLWSGEDFVIFGEWCGPGIMKKTAVNQIPEPVFAVFMIQTGPSDSMDTTCVYDPAVIAQYMGECPPRIHILPWFGPPISITWGDRLSLVRGAEMASDAVNEVETCDPWVKANFGVEGIGEGVVYYPMHITKRAWIGTHIFKAKGLAHKVKRSDKIVEIDPAVAASVAEFVEMFVTEARLEQGLAETGGKADVKLTGQFLAWFNKDVEKEAKDELAASNLTWTDVGKAVGAAARNWYVEKARTI